MFLCPVLSPKLYSKLILTQPHKQYRAFICHQIIMCRNIKEVLNEDTATCATSNIDNRNDNDESLEGAITFNQVKGHNTPKSAWTVVNNKVLDITKFSKRHPGGDIILLSAGKDATVLYHTYHPRGVPDAVLNKLTIGTLKVDSNDNGTREDGSITSYYNWDSPFYQTLCERVTKRLRERNLPLRGGYEIQVKAILILIGFWASLYKMYVSPFPTALVYTCVMGFFAHWVGTCIQHDGNHGAFSTNPLINTMAGWTMDMIGASAFTWQFQHMLGHHPYTNLLDVEEDTKRTQNIQTPITQQDQESDPDVFSSFPIMRMHPVHEPKWFHAYQHLYAPALFALMTLAKVFQQDIEVATSRKLYHIDCECRYGSVLNVMRFWGMKALSMVYMFALPCYFHGLKNGLILFTVGHLVCGEVLATMFIVNHVIEGVSFAKKNTGTTNTTSGSSSYTFVKPMTTEGITPMEHTMKHAKAELKNKVPLNDWAAVQCQTSVNWSSGSWFWNHFSGGLSHQIEHHLFPSICHTNYVHIQDVVESTCAEYGVPYQNEENLFVAYGKMLSHLKTMGSMKQC